MNKTNKIIEESEIVLKSLKRSVAKALHKKKCLGQYAVISENGKIIKLFTQENN